MNAVTIRERPADGEAQGLLILHHGRGTDENDLLGLADALDPQRRLHVVTPRGILQLPGWGGFHWYLVPRVGYPDPATFYASVEALSELHDQLMQSTGIPPERTVLGGFSMGCVMSYALGLGPGRPRPAGILALSGFIPTVEGWTPDLETRRELPVLIAHGRSDPVIAVEFARDARDRLEAAGLAVEYHESDGGHQIEPGPLQSAISWLAGVV